MKRARSDSVGVWKALYRTTINRCPACGVGHVAPTLFKLSERCPNCDVRFERSTGEVSGGMLINFTATVLGIAALLIFWLVFSGQTSDLWMWTSVGLFVIFFPILFYSRSRTLWVAVLYLTDQVYRDDDLNAD